ncbi:MAG: DUF3108 domain-containing protein [Thermoanaerobaculia bacterium]
MPHLPSARRPALLVLAGLVAALAGSPAGAGTPPGPATAAATTTRAADSADERLEYGWRVKGFFGAVAGLFFPNEGDGVLSRHRLENGNLESELLITSEKDDDPDYFRYGAEIAAGSGATVRAWSSQLWRGKTKKKEIHEVPPAAVDIASSIELLRRQRPRHEQRMEIWSDGKLYPVLVRPMGTERIEIRGRKIETLHVAVRPLVEPDRRVWKGELDLWLATDEAATPVEILVSRSPARVLLSLKSYP